MNPRSRLIPLRFLVASLALHAVLLGTLDPIATSGDEDFAKPLVVRLSLTPPIENAAVTASPPPREPTRRRVAPPAKREAAVAAATPIQAVAKPEAPLGAEPEQPANIAAPAASAPQADPLAAPAAAVAAVPRASAEAADRSILDAYTRTLSARIAKVQRYPALARMRGWQGTAVLTITVSPAGDVLKSSVARSSGYSVLDEQALRMVAEASPLPVFSGVMPGRSLEIELPVVFRLAAG